MAHQTGAAALLIDLLARPERAVDLSVPDWDRLLRVARRAKLLSRLSAVMDDHPAILALCPPEVAPMLRAARVYPDLIRVRASWELHQVLAATADLGTRFILLKGAAYLEAGLPLARARAFADLDLLVREGEVPEVEEHLLAAGYRHQQVNAYDQSYYRDWMHEIPPLSHPQRQMEVDIHHRILPRTSRLAPDPRLLWEASVPLRPRLRVLSPPDMVLHCAAHLFYDGEIAGDFRDLLDLHQLMSHFGAQSPGFWEALIERGRLLDLGRPLYYALRFSHEFLGTQVPEPAWTQAQDFAPPAPVLVLMGRLVRRALPPHDIGDQAPMLAAWLLYARAHWLRMPPWLLARHLMRKALRRLPRPQLAAKT